MFPMRSKSFFRRTFHMLSKLFKTTVFFQLSCPEYKMWIFYLRESVVPKGLSKAASSRPNAYGVDGLSWRQGQGERMKIKFLILRKGLFLFSIYLARHILEKMKKIKNCVCVCVTTMSIWFTRLYFLKYIFATQKSNRTCSSCYRTGCFECL